MFIMPEKQTPIGATHTRGAGYSGGYMAKIAKNELSKRKAELKRMVRADIVKREVMQFRLESDNIEKLYGLAVKKRKPVGTLVREWITERINAELGARQDNNELVVAEAGAQYTSGAKEAAKNGPVFITDRGRPAHVLMTIEEYQKLTGNHASIIDMLSMPGAEQHIEFEPPRLSGDLYRAADLS
jgi:PHD/YefM family antitoxin component YafN of YafNO toxin-antitoxin module